VSPRYFRLLTAIPKREIISWPLKRRSCFSRESKGLQKLIPHQEVLDTGKLAEREGFEPFFYREAKLLRNTDLIDD
jgi:hypothetical protein